MATLERRIGIPGAIMIGLGSMIGAGLFFVWVPAWQLAGEWLWLALLLAGTVATLNAMSTAQLAMRHPVSGGAYAYGRAEVSPAVGFAAGWMFLTGKTASAGAIALIAARHVWPDGAPWLAAALIAVLALVNGSGIRSTVRVTSAIVSVVLVLVMAALVWSALGLPTASATGLETVAPVEANRVDAALTGPLGVLTAAGMLFFAFAGYARMATLGDEVRDPVRTLPRAIAAGLAIVLVLYGLVAWATTGRLGDALAGSAAPVADLVGERWLHVALLGAAALASVGSLTGILAGLSRTGLAMARGNDLPGPLAYVWPRTKAPVVAEAATAAAAIAGVLLLPVGQLVAFSSTCVLTYYAVAHLSAIRGAGRPAEASADPDARPVRWWLPRWVPFAGLALCALLVVTLPWIGVVAAAVWLALGLASRGLLRRR
ncbi:APC family permease [Agrococcus sp. HG114]|uniref:APC family permease n=1 Tax=Agrococcus sp. HG114 TaxID=2969757 RepID=UPI00215A1DB7|nr:APC family permease [Agrococcus sp. HG114]MCR8669810.1 APC family permease [Agrococcus sp. HG114]